MGLVRALSIFPNSRTIPTDARRREAISANEITSLRDAR
jgi:hypothetical protein